MVIHCRQSIYTDYKDIRIPVYYIVSIEYPMGTIRIPFQITIQHTGSEVEEEWQTIDKLHLEAWRDAVKFLSQESFKHKRIDFTVEADWSEVPRRLVRKLDFKRRSDVGEQPSEGQLEFQEKSISIPATVSFNEINHDSGFPVITYFFISMFVYNFFMIMNLSAPGSCDFWGGEIISDDEILPIKDIGLSGYGFNYLWMKSLRGESPAIKYIPVLQVKDWYNSLNLGIKQLARNRIERALFAMLHVSRLAEPSQNSLIWICHAIEALIGSDGAASQSKMLARINLLSDPSDRNGSDVKKRLKSLYNIRNKYVHGSFEVSHPIGNEKIEPNVLKQMDVILDAHWFGIRVIIATFQKMIENKWIELNFEKKVRGK